MKLVPAYRLRFATSTGRVLDLRKARDRAFALINTVFMKDIKTGRLVKTFPRT
jgi:hypothetical protein